MQRIWMNVPKGFEKFYRNPNKQDNKQQQNNNQNDGKKDDKGGPKKKPEDNDNALWKTAAALGTILFLLSSFEDTKYGREISWQEFQKTLLETGQVDRIIVSNKNLAR